MKVFTFFYNRFETATTSIELEKNGIEHIVLMHTEEDKKRFEEGGRMRGVPIVTGQPKGLANQRNAALEMMEEGEWAVFMCDDFKHVKMLPKKWILSKRDTLPVNFENQNYIRLDNRSKSSLEELFETFGKLIEIAESNGIHLIGFGLNDNPLQLRRKFKTGGLADGRMWIVKKSSYTFDNKVQSIEDYMWTAENIMRHGKVLVLNWAVPHFDRYTKGGYGTTEERTEMRKRECRYLVNKYSPLIRYAEKKGWEEGTHIRIQSSKGNIRKARIKNGMI